MELLAGAEDLRIELESWVRLEYGVPRLTIEARLVLYFDGLHIVPKHFLGIVGFGDDQRYVSERFVVA